MVGSSKQKLARDFNKGRGPTMKTNFLRILTIVIAVVGLVLTSQAQSITYNGSISLQEAGTVTTTLPQFNNALGTLTGVQLTLNLTLTPVAQIINTTFSPEPFDINSYISASISSNIGNWTVGYGTDSWALPVPTLTTGNIYGSGQTLLPFTIFSIVGGTSGPAGLSNVSGSNLTPYIGGGTLALDVNGPQYDSGGGPVYNIGGGVTAAVGGNVDLVGTASVTYDYTAVPEPSTIGLVAFGLLGMLGLRLRKA